MILFCQKIVVALQNVSKPQLSMVMSVDVYRHEMKKKFDEKYQIIFYSKCITR